MRLRAALVVLLLAALPGCADSAPPVGGPVPDVTVATSAGPFRLAAAHGRDVVIQFAPADSVEAWATLASAAADLEAEGALVIGVSTDGPPPESPFRTATDAGGTAAAVFGYVGVPLAVVIDRSGVLRGIAAPRQADDLFALAAPVLLEGDGVGAEPVPVLGTALDADGVDRLVRGGAALIDLRGDAERAAEGPVRYALVCPPGRLAADVLPADVGAPVVLLGAGAAQAAEQAAGWGYANVHVVLDASGLTMGPAVSTPLDAPRPEPRADAPQREERPAAVRG